MSRINKSVAGAIAVFVSLGGAAASITSAEAHMSDTMSSSLESASLQRTSKAASQLTVPGLGTVIDSVLPTSLDCYGQPKTAFAQAQGTASPPLCTRSSWTYDLPSDAAPNPTRRTESHWGSGNAVQTFREGDTVTYEAEYVGNLGPAAQKDDDWHVIWQLHGPVYDQWPGPAMGLNIRNGQLRIGGGDGHEGQNYATKNYEWMQVLAPWQDGVPVRVKVQTYLTTNPSAGWVSAWVNGKQLLNRYKPVSYGSNLMPGTIYQGQTWVASRTGLYRGTQRGTPPTYRQVINARVFSVG